jgi:hypothetical protein
MSHTMRHIQPLKTETLLDARSFRGRSRRFRTEMIVTAIAKALGIGRASVYRVLDVV